MASTYVNDLRLNEMATGDASGSWGTVTNTNLELIGEALGYGTEGITTNADTHTTTVADGATDPGRAMYIEYTGTLDSACTITIAPNTLNRMHFIENGTSGSQNIIIKQGSGATITIPPGDTKAVYLDGAGSGAKVVDAFASLNVVDLKVQDDLTVTDDATIGGTLGVTGVLTATSLDISGAIDVDGTSNLDVVDIDGAVDMASTLQVDGAITSSAGATITTADNSENLILKSTDADASVGPQLTLWRASGSPADDDLIGQISYNANDDGGNVTNWATIFGKIRDASDGSEDAQLTFKSMVAGTSRNRLEFNEGEAVFNDDSVDINFRVESNGNANMLFVDAGNDRVGIGTASPGVPLDVISDSSAEGVKVRGRSADEIAQLSFTSNAGSSTYSMIQSLSTEMKVRAVANIPVTFHTNNTERWEIEANGNFKASTNGLGINFEASKGGGETSTLLDDYEEGTWTPAVASDASASAYNYRNGYYTKIGRQVRVTCQFRISTIGSFSGAIINLQGLPYNINNLTNYDPIGVIAIQSAATAKNDIFVRGIANTDRVRIEGNNGNTSSDRNVNANMFDTDTVCFMDFTYFTA